MRWRVWTLFLAALVAAPAGAQQIGVSEWVNPNAWSEPPGAADREPLAAFELMMPNELIETDERGASDILFNRGSRLLVGPECGVVLDETYYDRRLDEVVSGEVYAETVCVVRAGADGETLVLVTPIATVTISDAQATIAFAAAGSTVTAPAPSAGAGAGADFVVSMDMALDAGATVDVAPLAGGRPTVLRRPGFIAVHITDEGFTDPVPATAQLLAAIHARMEGLGRPAVIPTGLDLAPGALEIWQAEPRLPDVSPPRLDCTFSSFCDTFVIELPRENEPE